MEENKAAQEEELEVLKSIYEGDEQFKVLTDTSFQYRFGEEGEKGTILIEVQWPSDYPTVCPKFSLGAFYNNHLSGGAKRALVAALEEEATKNEGSQQTYTLIEWARESYLEVVTPFLSEDVSSGVEGLSLDSDPNKGQEDAKLKVKKEQLTKSQKRREWDKVDSKGEKARGYDWVDIVKHLSQTGPSRPEGSTTGFSSNDSYLPSCDLPS